MGLISRVGLFVGVVGTTACGALLGDFTVKDGPLDGGGGGGSDGPNTPDGSDTPDAPVDGGVDSGGEAGTPVELVEVDVGGSAPTTNSGHNTCVRLSNGNTRCLGSNHIGQLGRSPAPQDRLPAGLLDLPATVNLTSISLSKSPISNGTAFGCGVDNKQKAWCWGSNLQSELGRGSIDNIPHPQPQPVLAGTSLPPIDGITQISAGGRHTCFVGPTTGSSQNVYCVGSDISCTVTGKADASGNCPSDTSFVTAPNIVSGMPKGAAVATGAASTCALDSGRTEVWCWGNNKYSTMGRGSGYTLGSGSPDKVLLPSGLGNIAELVMGNAFGCVLSVGKRVVCWGQNNDGQLGPTTGNLPDPVYVDSLAGSDHIAAAQFNLCGYKSKSTTDKINCIGNNAEGQLAFAVNTGVNSVPAGIGIFDVVSMSIGGGHACAIGKKPGTGGALPPARALYCWGKNSAGQASPMKFVPRIIDPEEVPLGP